MGKLRGLDMIQPKLFEKSSQLIKSLQLTCSFLFSGFWTLDSFSTFNNLQIWLPMTFLCLKIKINQKRDSFKVEKSSNKMRQINWYIHQQRFSELIREVARALEKVYVCSGRELFYRRENCRFFDKYNQSWYFLIILRITCFQLCSHLLVSSRSPYVDADACLRSDGRPTPKHQS